MNSNSASTTTTTTVQNTVARIRHGLLALSLCLLVTTSCQPSIQPNQRLPLPRTRLTIKGHIAHVELARLPHERNLGLMYRQKLAPDSGMLFIFDRDETLRFWMRNTYIPLSIAFCDSSGIITDILDMAPLDDTTDYSSSQPVRFALEMNQGWFATRAITPGDTIHNIPKP